MNVVLQERLDYQQKYIDLLQSEKKDLQSRPNKNKLQPAVKQVISTLSLENRHDPSKVNFLARTKFQMNPSCRLRFLMREIVSNFQGSSGKSVIELEKTIALMKKVVERVQRENDQLKRAPGVVSNQLLEDLKIENQDLQVILQLHHLIHGT